MTFERQQATALKLIAKNGKDAAWQKMVVTSDPTKPWLPPAAALTTVATVKLVVLPFNSNDPQYQTQAWSKILGDTRTGLFKALMGNVSFTPENTDVVVINGKTYSVLHFKELAPNMDEKLLYTLILKV